jgi:very-short-patch-repair endonuclease
MGKSDKKNLTPGPSPARERGADRRGEVLPRARSLDPRILTAARELRKKQTTSEQILWTCLRNRRLGGLKFKRQHPICKFVADFYCHEAGLVIELDGAVHLERDQAERDKIRTEIINNLGISVLRFNNSQIKNELEKCLNSILGHARSLIDGQNESG